MAKKQEIKERKNGISIIVPVYNVENYLSQCVDSLLQKHYDNIEILLIDDGSTDRSPKICDEYAKQNDMVQVFHKKNGGLSDARNYGIEKAKYDYLMFIDSDDWVDEKMIPLLQRKITDGVDLVLFDAYEVQDGETKGSIRKCFLGEKQEISNFVLGSTEPSYAWARMYHYSLFDKIKFPSPDLWYEDIATVPILTSYAKKIDYIEEPLYYYRQRLGSITSRKENDRNLEVIKCCERVLKNVNPQYKQEAEYAIYYVLNNFMTYRAKYMDDYVKAAKKHSKEFNQNPYIQQAIQNLRVNDLMSIELIPKKIHYFWLGGEKPESVKRCIESWKKFAPDYEIVEWNETNCDVNETVYTKEANDTKKYAFVSDYFRLKVLYEYGGIYMDTDMELFDRIDFVRCNKAFFPFETDEVCAGIIGAIPHHPIIKEIFDTYTGEHFKNEDGTLNTRPIPYRITRVIKKHYKYDYACETFYCTKDRFTIYSVDIFIANVANGKNIAVHHYDATWWNPMYRNQSYLYNVLKYYFTHVDDKPKEKGTIKERIFQTGRDALHKILPESVFKKVRKLYRKIKPIK